MGEIFSGSVRMVPKDAIRIPPMGVIFAREP